MLVNKDKNETKTNTNEELCPVNDDDDNVMSWWW